MKNWKHIVIETVAGDGFFTFQQIHYGKHCFTFFCFYSGVTLAAFSVLRKCAKNFRQLLVALGTIIMKLLRQHIMSGLQEIQMKRYFFYLSYLTKITTPKDRN